MTLTDLERLIRRDPARRGLLASDQADQFCRGHLAGAARSLMDARGVGIVTGFYVPDADPPAAETDGLSGSILLADMLQTLGIEAFLITDPLCEPSLSAGLVASGCRDLELFTSPRESALLGDWSQHLQQQLTHLIAVERSGPAHTLQTLQAQSWCNDATLADYSARIRPETHGRCHNMRGVDIHETTAELYRLFELPLCEGMTTIGICDGGNEIGAGRIPWPQLAQAIAGSFGPQIACRVATDWTILAGVSDWGAFGLAAALCQLRGDMSPVLDWTAERIESLLHAAVKNGPSVDGITRRPEPTVDGLPFITYIQPWLHIRGQLGLDAG